MELECCFKDSLIDLNGHRPPSKYLEHNRGYYAVLSLAHNLGRAIDLIANRKEREDKMKTGRKAYFRMRLGTLRRKIFALPGFITASARKSTIRIIGGGEANIQMFQNAWNEVKLC
jgi:hypothetical protein